jgi:hypothetical protein
MRQFIILKLLRLTAPVTAAKKVGEAVAHYRAFFFGAFVGAR